VLFSPGVIYSSAGTYTLRALVTDTWYTLGNPDDVGLYGDIEDTSITVTEFACPEFDLEPIDLVFLNLPWESRILPFYVKFDGPVPVDPPYEYKAFLGDLESYKCGPQGEYEDRSYCLAEIPEGYEGKEVSFAFVLVGCEEFPIHELPAVQIPIPIPPAKVCSADLDEKACEAAGGTFYRINDKQSTCLCD
jgi:hypothetical protein